jgi:cytochrome b
MLVGKCVTVLNTTDNSKSTVKIQRGLPEEGTQGVPNHVGEDFVQMLYIYIPVHVRLVFKKNYFHTSHGI